MKPEGEGFELGTTRLITVHQSLIPRGLRAPGPLNQQSGGRVPYLPSATPHERRIVQPVFEVMLRV